MRKRPATSAPTRRLAGRQTAESASAGSTSTVHKRAPGRRPVYSSRGGRAAKNRWLIIWEDRGLILWEDIYIYINIYNVFSYFLLPFNFRKKTHKKKALLGSASDLALTGGIHLGNMFLLSFSKRKIISFLFCFFPVLRSDQSPRGPKSASFISVLRTKERWECSEWGQVCFFFSDEWGY